MKFRSDYLSQPLRQQCFENSIFFSGYFLLKSNRKGILYFRKYYFCFIRIKVVRNINF